MTDAELHAAVGIGRLLSSYADVVTRRAWAELHDLFVPDAPVDIEPHGREPVHVDGPEELGAFISGAIERFDFFQLVILNNVVDVTGPDAATGRAYISELRTDRGSGEWTTAFGRYDDTYAYVDGRWRFASRHYRTLARIPG